MSVPGLYHHVRTREQLLAMAAAHSLGRLALPERSRRCARCVAHALRRFVFDALVEQPELIGQIVAGTVNTMRHAQHLERFFAVFADHGRGVIEAYEAYAQLTATVAGAAAFAVGISAAEAAGHSTLADLRRAAGALGADETPLVHELVRRRRREPDPFAAIRIAIDAIASDRVPAR